jgi:hypothetical protein
MTHQPRNATPAMHSGIAMPSSRHVTSHRFHVVQRFGSRGRSSASPTPIRATSTQNSVRCSVNAWLSMGDADVPPGIGSSPIRAPASTSTMGGDNARRLVAFGRTTATSRDRPASR